MAARLFRYMRTATIALSLATVIACTQDAPRAAKKAPMPPKPAPAVDVTGVADASTAFATDLWARLATTKGNLALSPASLSTALAMTWSGAGGETAAQMRRVLHLDAAGDDATVLAASGTLSSGLTRSGGGVELRVANRLFGERSFAFERAYLDRTAKAFGAPLEPLDFKAGADAAIGHINGWVAKQTNDRIANLLPPRSLGGDTRLVLVNAIHFLGKWATPFPVTGTAPQTFHLAGGAKGDVHMMHNRLSARYAQHDGLSVLELPYQGGDAAMVVLLPAQPDGLAAVEAALTPAQLAAWMKPLAVTTVDVALPRFKIDPPAPLDVGGALQALGMTDAFSPTAADFTAIGKPANPADRLYVSQVFHKAFVQVDEAGTEAAGATAVVMVEAGAAPVAAPAFTADHPFLFAIIDTKTKAILFMGRVADPR